MKKIIAILAAAILAIGINAADNKGIVVAYVTSYTSDIIPDPTVMTHLNYAFGHVAASFDSVRVDKPQRLRLMSSLKQQNPDLKVMLSIGGWTSGNFSEMAADRKLRESFARDCRRVVDEYDLDGIDIDWEYPSSDAAGISCSPDDIDNFTLLMRDIRKEIGNDKLLTLASIASADFINFKDVEPYVDFVNIMVYDLARPPYHHASLFRSDKTKGVSCEEAIDLHIKNGMPARKLTLGMPFYGHGTVDLGMSDFIDYRYLGNVKGDYRRMRDEVAKVPYMADADGTLVVTFDDAESIAAKCGYAKERGLKGVMYWEYATDDNDGTLRNTVAREMLGR